jgi:TPR repeat protein
MRLAQKWHSDAQMIDLRIRESNNYVLEFDFSSPSDRSTFYVQLINGQFTSQVMPPVTTSATGDPLPLEFLDLTAAIVQAEQQGMPHVIKEADLQASSSGSPRLAWAIQPETDHPPYLYTVNAAAGAAASVDQSPNAQSLSVGANSTSGGPSAPASVEPVMASGLLQKCLGITRGADKMLKGPATQQYCEQLPEAQLYDQAGQRFQAGDHAAAAQIVTRAAQAGNAVAQLRLALMYDQGDGVARSAKAAFTWYARAAAQGEPESQNQVGLFYELGEGVDENWDLAAKLDQASASQGWLKGQFSLGRAYQFGIGVPQNRQQAIAWFQKAGAQGDPKGAYWAKWLSSPSNNIGFRDDTERSIVMDVAGRMRFAVSAGDPAGVAFHNSAQRALWLEGQRQRADQAEAETFRQIRQADHEACLRAGRDNCY